MDQSPYSSEIIYLFKNISIRKKHSYKREGKTMRNGPIRCVRTPLHESFDEDMKRIKEERGKLIQKMSDKCITASDFTRDTQNC